MADVVGAHVLHRRSQLFHEKFARGFRQSAMALYVCGQIAGVAQFHDDVNISDRTGEKYQWRVFKRTTKIIGKISLTFRPIGSQSFRRCACVSKFSTVLFPWVNYRWSSSKDLPWPHILWQMTVSYPEILRGISIKKWQFSTVRHMIDTYFMLCSMNHRIASAANDFQQFIIIQLWHRHIYANIT